jgi:hypothetical protein
MVDFVSEVIPKFQFVTTIPNKKHFVWKFVEVYKNFSNSMFFFFQCLFQPCTIFEITSISSRPNYLFGKHKKPCHFPCTQVANYLPSFGHPLLMQDALLPWTPFCIKGYKIWPWYEVKFSTSLPKTCLKPYFQLAQTWSFCQSIVNHLDFVGNIGKY